MFTKNIRKSLPLSRSIYRRFTSYQTGSEGATASTGSFGQKEKAIENQWARAHDADKIKLLRKALANQEKATASLKKDLETLEKRNS
ncbi:hypothetical protein G6F46_006202 [Rhizopus delemar]|uniref:ATPase inhibitor, mitochondrial n=3 Tax=Rhizopus TaxID=4842 RepID=I1C7K6_RHIO9|nr:hypothetical protein RO3G_09146 [Rhizopus delemar RA 99-880]KAG1459382.1 hypothetical protein G6F55_004799 [Rhizopus delemar]KAG1544109.1 hypothetical protein G6F51_006267 [Rhizopus arrhizus]KAG1497774.1 hypothetical protein G6F54_005538 [Rhizopus delemar]KAG1511543.1 hypothetical protein G6F53_005865 [Rhizopus delemar]|eukprot:EIE84436.1 hypothetical protein RO3G_09146 [Rhizopus delemar RA 99-880]